jgi:opacity protein-like surface antigen
MQYAVPQTREGASMTRLQRLAAAALVAAFASTAAKAEPETYVAVFGGIDLPDDERINGTNANGDLRDIDVGFDQGELFGAALGIVSDDFSFGRVRGEIEFSSRESDLESLSLNSVDRTVNAGSHVSVQAGMLNAYYDTPQFFDRVRFSLGAGLGVAAIDHQIRYLIAVPPAIGSIPGQIQIAIPSSEVAHAYQLIGAMEVELSSKLSLTADARYFDLGDVQTERFVLNSFINGVPTTTGTLDSILDARYATTSFTVGFRYKF